jgi:hypothetical protein
MEDAPAPEPVDPLAVEVAVAGGEPKGVADRCEAAGVVPISLRVSTAFVGAAAREPVRAGAVVDAA